MNSHSHRRFTFITASALITLALAGCGSSADNAIPTDQAVSALQVAYLHPGCVLVAGAKVTEYSGPQTLTPLDLGAANGVAITLHRNGASVGIDGVNWTALDVPCSQVKVQPSTADTLHFTCATACRQLVNSWEALEVADDDARTGAARAIGQSVNIPASGVSGSAVALMVFGFFVTVIILAAILKGSFTNER